MVCGVPPRGLITAVSRPHPFFSFFGKRKEGGEKKKQGQQTRRKRTRRIFSVLSTQECDRAQGRFSSQHRLSAEKRVLSPRYKRADARSILGRSPKLYNRVWSPRLKTASPINRVRIIPPRLRLPSTGSPYGLGGLSRRDRQGQSVHPSLLVLLMQRSPRGVGRPTFRCVWLRRREAGLAESRTGCRGN